MRSLSPTSPSGALATLCYAGAVQHVAIPVPCNAPTVLLKAIALLCHAYARPCIAAAERCIAAAAPYSVVHCHHYTCRALPQRCYTGASPNSAYAVLSPSVQITAFAPHN